MTCRPSCAANSRVTMPLKVLGPSLATVSRPGLALANATRSWKVLSGEPALTDTANGTLPTMPTGTKSRFGSYGRLLNR
ncbi:hypothetical protein D3C71_2104540 [compost metagenome]